MDALAFSIFAKNLLLRVSLDIIVVCGIIFIIILAGYILSLYLGKKINNIINKLVKNIPVVNSIYFAIKSLVDGLAVGSKKAFKRAVYVEYPKKNMWVIGFVTGETKLSRNKLVSIFIPTAPNPTSGFLIFTKPSAIRETNLTIEEAFKVIISGGIISPNTFKK